MIWKIKRIDFVHNILWGGTDEFKAQIIEPLDKIFSVGFKFSQAFTYFGKEIHQMINQNNYTNAILPI